MDCPRCYESVSESAISCAVCGFAANGRSLQKWSNLTYLLAELAEWHLPETDLAPLRQKYTRLLKASEIELGLRPPPPDALAARGLQEERSRLTVLQEALRHWASVGWLAENSAAEKQHQFAHDIQAIDERLEDVAAENLPASGPKYALRRLAEQQAVLQLAQDLYQMELLSELGWVRIAAEQKAAIDALEIEAGLRQPVPSPETKRIEDEIAIEGEEAVKQKRWQRPSLTWDQVWESLLSERTLHALLFLGVLLLLASGVSWVVWNWDTFPPLAQIGFLGSMTAAFFGLGWYVRSRMKLVGSGIALTAVAALLIPLDFYAYYISGGFPPGSWPTVWLVASVVCLGAYLLVAYLWQALFFGYLVALALGSLLLSLLNLGGVGVDWWVTAVTSFALGLAIISEMTRRRLDQSPRLDQSKSPQRHWHFLAVPFGQIALIVTVPVMLVGMLYSLLVGDGAFAFYLSLAASWWLGGLTLLLMTRRYHMQTLVWATAVSFPIALWLTMRLLFSLWQVDVAWYGLGWLLLAPFYFGTAALCHRFEDDAFGKMAGKTAVIIGSLLVVVAALWSWQAPLAAACVYLLMAVGAGVAAWVSQKSRFLWLMSLALAVSTAGWLASRGANAAELALPWALLSIVHLVAALLGESRLPTKRASFLAPLYGAAILLAGAALLPPLVLFDQPLLAYGLANWLGINGWLAMLAHQKTPGLLALLAYRRLRRVRVALFHWLTALPLVAWVALVWTIERPPSVGLGVLMLGLAWLTMGLTLGLRRLRWAYGLPWKIASILAAVLAFWLAFYHINDFLYPTNTWVVGGTAVYFLTAVWAFRSSRYFYAAGLLLPFTWTLIYLLSDIDYIYWQTTWGIFPLAYVLAGIWLEQKRGRERPFTQPFYRVALALSLPILAVSLLASVYEWDDSALLWTAFAPAWLGLATGAYAWLTDKQRWAHLSIWLITLAGGLLVKTFSHGSGRSAALVACLAIVYVLAERALHWLALKPLKMQRFEYRRWWLLTKRPLLTAGWLLSVAAIGAALVRNLIWLGGGVGRQSWSIVALLLITGLYALSARLFRRVRFVWLASLLIIIPWTLAGDLIWGDEMAWYGLSCVVLGLGLLGVGLGLTQRLGWGKWSWPSQVVAHLLVPTGLLLTIFDPAVASAATGLTLGFYLAAAAIDRFYGPTNRPPSARFLFPVAALLPVWAIFVCLWLFPTIAVSTLALVVWLFVLPLLATGCWLKTWEPEYRWPFYIVAYTVAGAAIAIVGGETAVLSLLLLLNSGVAIFSVWLFREPLWWYPAAVLLPLAGWALLADLRVTEGRYYGWTVIAAAGLYLLGAWLLRQWNLRRYETPLIVMTFITLFFGLPLCSGDRLDAFVGYGMAVIILTLAAVWLRRPLVFSAAVALTIVPYGVVLSWLDVADENIGLALWPGIVAALALAVYLDKMWGVEPIPAQPKLSAAAFPWTRLGRWPRAIWERWTRWWALSLYGLALALISFSALVGAEDAGRWLLVLVAGTAVFLWLTRRFRLRGWLLASGVWGQMAALAFIRLIGLTASGAQVALAFMPVAAFTFFMGFLVEQGLGENGLFYRENGRLRLSLSGWSLPFYTLLLVNVTIGQMLTFDLGWESVLVTLLNGVIVGLLATHWRLRLLGYGATALGVLALGQWLVWLEVADTVWPMALALLALVYGAVGYGWRRWRREEVGAPRGLEMWERPFIRVGWLVSGLALLNAFILSVDLVLVMPRLFWTGGGLLLPDMQVAQMLVRTFALLGLFYLTAALVEQKPRLSYLALLLLFTAWSLWLLLIQGARELQLYAVPAGFYLLLLGWLEWRRGSRGIARWLDWVGVLLLYGSAFWQSFGAHGEWYALLMIGEGLLIAWLGSLRRLRRLLYLGVAGVITAVAGQLIEPLFALNTFVLLLLGALLVGLGIALERRLEKVRELSQELRAKMEHWE